MTPRESIGTTTDINAVEDSAPPKMCRQRNKMPDGGVCPVRMRAVLSDRSRVVLSRMPHTPDYNHDLNYSNSVKRNSVVMVMNVACAEVMSAYISVSTYARVMVDKIKLNMIDDHCLSRSDVRNASAA